MKDMSAELMHDVVIRYDRHALDEAEIRCQEKIAAEKFGATVNHSTNNPSYKTDLVQQIEQARQKIQDAITSTPETIKTYINRVDSLEQENKSLKSTVSSLQSSLKALEDRVKSLELGSGAKTTGKAAASTKKADSDSDVDLFGSDDEDEKPAPKPVAKPAAKKPVKAGPIAKSLIQLYVKPWDDETDMKVMEKLVRSVEMDGLMWGTSQLVPVGYGIKKLQIACVVEDDKVGTDDLEEKISAFEDLVQSVDIASFNKL